MSQENETALLPRDIENLEKLLNYAGEKKGDVEKLRTKVTNMRWFGLRWDSKVPEEDKWLFHFFTLKKSDRSDVLKEIGKYVTLYEKIVDGISKLKNPNQMSDSEREDPRQIINELFDKIKECLTTAEEEKNKTSSSTIFNLHKVFIKQYKKLDELIERAESAALRITADNAVTMVEQNNERINTLMREKNDAELRFDMLCNKFGESIDEYNKLAGKFAILMDMHINVLSGRNNEENENTELRERQRELEENIERLQREMTDFQRRNQETLEEKKNLQTQIEEIKRRNNSEHQENQRLKKELEKLQQENGNIQSKAAPKSDADTK